MRPFPSRWSVPDRGTVATETAADHQDAPDFAEIDPKISGVTVSDNAAELD